MLFQLFTVLFTLASAARNLDFNDIRLQLKHRRRRAPTTKWIPRRRADADLDKPIDPALVDQLFAVTDQIAPAAWESLVDPDAHPASNDDEPQVAAFLGDLLGDLADAIQNILANLNIDAIVAQIQGTIANLAEIIENIAASVVELTEAIVAEVANVVEIVNEITAAAADLVAVVAGAAAAGRRLDAEEEQYLRVITQVDALNGVQLNNLMDSDLPTIGQTNTVGPLDMQDLNNMQDHVAMTAASLNLNADALADLIDNLANVNLQDAIANVLDQLANVQAVIANIADAAGLQAADLEIVAAANMEDLSKTGELTTAEIVDLTNIQDAINGALANVDLDALAGLSADAIANLANLDLADIQAKLGNIADVDLDAIIAQIKDNVPDVAAALDQIANLKDALANLDIGLNVANLDAVETADLNNQAQLDVLSPPEIAELQTLQDALAAAKEKVGDNLPDGLNINDIQDIKDLVGAQKDDVANAIANAANAANVQDLLDKIANDNVDIAKLQEIVQNLKSNGDNAQNLAFLQDVNLDAYKQYMSPQVAQAVETNQNMLNDLWARGVDNYNLPSGMTESDIQRLNDMTKYSLDQVIAGMRGSPDINQFRAMMDTAEANPAPPVPVATTAPPAVTRRPRNPTPTEGTGNPNGSGANPMGRGPRTPRPGMNPGMNGGMGGNAMGNGMNGGMNGGMHDHNDPNQDHSGHDHEHTETQKSPSGTAPVGEDEEEPAIYTNPIVVGAVVVILLGVGFLAYKKFANKPDPQEGLLGREVQRDHMPSYDGQKLTV